MDTYAVSKRPVANKYCSLATSLKNSKLKMKKIYVVTGGAGFIGSHIAERLLNDGHSVHIVDNFFSGKISNLARLSGDFHVHQVSITDLSSMRTLFAGVDTVFHHAALASVTQSVDDPLLNHEYNVTGTLNVLLAARDTGVRRVVFAASSAAYGDISDEYKLETMRPSPTSPYGTAKVTGEYYCQVFSRVYDLETVCLRYFNVFGPRQDPQSQYAAVIPLFITALLQGNSPTIYGDGLQSRDFVYVENVVHANLLAAESPAANGQIINVAIGNHINLLELLKRINNILGTNIQPQHMPERTGDIKHSCADITKARQVLNYRPIVDFDAGLARTIEWYRSGS
ncbi:MAG: SDR family oxidoreductase [Anaerolineae bacterium]